MKKLTQSILFCFSMLLVGNLYAAMAGADIDAIMIRWPQTVTNSASPILIYKRVKNPIAADATGCQLHDEKNNQGEIVWGDPGSQCYVWRQVGYLDSNASPFSFIDPPSAKDGYGAPVGYKFVQGQMQQGRLASSDWIGLRGFTVDQLASCTNNCITISGEHPLFSTVYGLNSVPTGINPNYLVAILSLNPQGFIDFDYSKRLPGFYLTPSAQQSMNITLWNSTLQSPGADSNTIFSNLSSTTIALGPQQFTSQTISLPLTNFIFWADQPSGNRMGEIVSSTSLGAPLWDFLIPGAASEGKTFTYDFFPSDSVYCLALGLDKNDLQGPVTYLSINDPLQRLYFCPAQTPLNLETYAFCPQGNGCGGDPSVLPSLGIGNLFVFYSKGSPYVYWENDHNDIYTRFTVSVNGDKSANVAASSNDKFVVFPLNNLNDGINEVDVSPANYTALHSTDSFLKLQFFKGPIIQTSHPSDQSVKINPDNNLNGSLYLTTIPGYDLNHDLSFQLYADGGPGACSLQGGSSVPCNPNWIYHSVNIPFQYDPSSGQVTLGQNTQGDQAILAPAEQYHLFGLLSDSNETYQAFKGGTNNAPWDNPPACGESALPSVSGSVVLNNFCVFTQIAPITNANLYSITAPNITNGVLSDDQKTATITFTPLQFDPDGLYDPANALTSTNFDFTYQINSQASKSFTPSCVGNTCSATIDVSDVADQPTFQVAMTATLANAAQTSSWLNQSDITTNSNSYAINSYPVLTQIDPEPATITSPTALTLSWRGGAPASQKAGIGSTITITATCQDANCPDGGSKQIIVNNANSPQNITGLAPGHTYGIEMKAVGTGYPTDAMPAPQQASINPSPVTPAYQLHDVVLNLTPSFTASGAGGINKVTANWREDHSGDAYFAIDQHTNYLNPASPGVPVTINYNLVLCSGNVTDYASCRDSRIGAIQSFSYADTQDAAFSGLTPGSQYTVCALVYGNDVQEVPSIEAPVGVVNPLPTKTVCQNFTAAQYTLSGKPTIHAESVTQNHEELSVSWDDVSIHNNIDQKSEAGVVYTVTCTSEDGQVCGISFPGAGRLGASNDAHTTTGTDAILTVTQPGKYTFSVTAKADDSNSWRQVAATSDSQTLGYYQFSSSPKRINITPGDHTTDVAITWEAATLLPEASGVTYQVTATPTGSIGSTITHAHLTTNSDSMVLDPGGAYDVVVTAKAIKNGATLSTDSTSVPYNAYTISSPTLAAPSSVVASDATMGFSAATITPVSNAQVTYEAIACPGENLQQVCSHDDQVAGKVINDTVVFTTLKSDQFYTVWVTATAKPTDQISLHAQSNPVSFETKVGFNIVSIPTPSDTNTTLKILPLQQVLQVKIPEATFNVSPDSQVYTLHFTPIDGANEIKTCTLPKNAVSGTCPLIKPVSKGERYNVIVELVATKDGDTQTTFSKPGEVGLTE